VSPTKPRELEATPDWFTSSPTPPATELASNNQ
jgi:hypothetical protein